MSNPDELMLPIAMVAIAVIGVMAVYTIVEKLNEKRCRTKFQQAELQKVFRERFGLELPRREAELTRAEPEVMRKIEVAGSFQNRIPELVGNRARAGSPEMGVVIMLTGLLGRQKGSAPSRYVEMRELALQAGYPKKRLDEIDSQIQKKARELSAA